MSQLRSVRSGSASVAVVASLLGLACESSGTGRDTAQDAGRERDASPAARDVGADLGFERDLGLGTKEEVRAAGCRSDGDHQTTLVFVNACAGAVSYAGSDLVGGTLAAGESRCVDIGSDVEALNSKRYWGWLGPDPGAERHTLAEFTFNTTFNDFDWYNISMVDAFNLPMQIVPLDRPSCKVLTCAADFLSGCPVVGQVRDAAGNLIACQSPKRDDPTSPVAQYFEACDDAYAWSGDDGKGSDPSPMRACAGEDWSIVFCPGGA